MKAPRAAVACVLLLGLIPWAAPAAAAPRIAPRQQLVTLLAAHKVSETPTTTGKVLKFLSATRPITGQPTVLPVLAQSTDERGLTWLRVRLPGRALNATTPPRLGWISARNTLRSTTPWHLVVNLRARRVNVYYAGRVLRSYRSIIGKRSTPTPAGEYFVEENIQLNASRTGAPFALATSARSTVLQEFDGGPGQIALHGLQNVGGQLGTAASHGCIRLANNAITWLAARIPSGAPVTIIEGQM